MAKIIGQLEFHIEKIIHELETTAEKTPYIKSLISIVKSEYKKLDVEAWKRQPETDSVATIEDIFFEQELLAFSTIERAILFILYSYYISSIDEDFLNIVNFISNAFERTNVFPQNFKLYFDMLIDKEILDLIFVFSIENPTYVIVQLINCVSLEDLRRKNYEQAKMLLCDIKGRTYSPIFNGYYDIETVYETLKYILNDPHKALHFTQKDRRNVELLREIKAIATDDFKTHFRNRIMEIESLCPNQETTLVKAISSIIPELLFEARIEYEKQDKTCEIPQPK